jgi:hypothetical protein
VPGHLSTLFFSRKWNAEHFEGGKICRAPSVTGSFCAHDHLSLNRTELAKKSTEAKRPDPFDTPQLKARAVIACEPVMMTLTLKELEIQTR